MLHFNKRYVPNKVNLFIIRKKYKQLVSWIISFFDKDGKCLWSHQSLKNKITL